MNFLFYKYCVTLHITAQAYPEKTCNEKEEDMVHQILKLKSVHPTVGYSHAAKAGNMLYIAGQVAQDVDGNVVGKGDFIAQFRQVYKNLKNIMEEAGGSLQNIVKMTTFLTHYNYIETYRSVRNEYFSEPFPPNTLLIIESLALPDYMIEVEAIAALD
ncbi:MAG: RidA family protein [Desulfobacterales bacterium]|nr:MAG: RidA family protein [Desulfobacterales bacterium]